MQIRSIINRKKAKEVFIICAEVLGVYCAHICEVYSKLAGLFGTQVFGFTLA